MYIRIKELHTYKHLAVYSMDLHIVKMNIAYNYNPLRAACIILHVLKTECVSYIRFNIWQINLIRKLHGSA